jgi:DNA-binding YbaB/EbfC family protein
MEMSKKRGGMPGGMGGFGGGGGDLLRQLQKMSQQMEKDMAEAREALEKETTEVSVGGGAVTVVITGHQRIQSITIKKEALDTEDPEWVNDLQDMLQIAVNQAIEQSQTMAAQRMEAITGGLGNVPGLGSLLGG